MPAGVLIISRSACLDVIRYACGVPIVFSAIMTQPLAHGPDWPHLARRQLAIYLAGLVGHGSIDIPDPPVTSQDIEATFALRAGIDVTDA